MSLNVSTSVFQVRFNLLQYVVPEVKELYNWLEVDFHPLKLSGRVTKVSGLLAAIFVVLFSYMLRHEMICLLGVELGERSG